ncbi:unnamed protein product [Symbiodinium microadriaticum]|nr:unnamed protein product [Symbiodinium microadriaticum]CAE7945497.1 unnamed protein product [Symbiodinium sp. KB8]
MLTFGPLRRHIARRPWSGIRTRIRTIGRSLKGRWFYPEAMVAAVTRCGAKRQGNGAQLT